MSRIYTYARTHAPRPLLLHLPEEHAPRRRSSPSAYRGLLEEGDERGGVHGYLQTLHVQLELRPLSSLRNVLARRGRNTLAVQQSKLSTNERIITRRMGMRTEGRTLICAKKRRATGTACLPLQSTSPMARREMSTPCEALCGQAGGGVT